MTALEAVFKQITPDFLVAVLVDSTHQTIASHFRPGLDKTTTRTPLATARRIFQNPDSRAALATLRESVFYDLDGRRLVCRPLQLGGKLHVLIVLIPAEKPYRRQLNFLVRQIEAAFKP
jgi:hypothetical protein